MSSVHFLVQPKELDELNAKLDRVIMYLERWDKRCHDTNMLTLPVRTTQPKPRMARDSVMEPQACASDVVPANHVDKKSRKPATLAEALKSSDEHLDLSSSTGGKGLQAPPAKKSTKKVDAPEAANRKTIDIPGFVPRATQPKKKSKTAKPDKKLSRKRAVSPSEDQEELLVSLAPTPGPITTFSQKSDEELEEAPEEDEEFEEDDDDDFVVEKQE